MATLAYITKVCMVYITIEFSSVHNLQLEIYTLVIH